MKYRNLGETGIIVSEIGFGSWGIGGGDCSYGPVDDNESIKTLQFAFDHGINFYDTSDSYGNGHSEEIIGKALRKARKKIIIATKGGCLPHNIREMPQDFSPKHLQKSLEKSLQRLQTDYIDLYQLHSPLINILSDGTVIKTLKKMKNEGKIRLFGISVRSPDDGLIAIKKYNFDCVQVNFNLIDQRAIDSGLLALAKQKGTGIISRTPFVFGFLTGKYSEKTKFSDGDHRRNWPKAQLKKWAEATKLFDFLSKKNKLSLAQLALKFCLSYDSVSTVIPGMMNTAQVSENIQSSEFKNLNSNALSAIKKIYEKNIFFDPSLKRSSDKK